MRVPAAQLVGFLADLFHRHGVNAARSKRLAELYTQASADGVYSHGVHFVPSILKHLRDKRIADTESDPKLISSFGALERYDGNLGLGALNAEFCIDRAMSLADAYGVGCVALR